MDKTNQNRHRKRWEGIEEGWRVISSFSPLPFFILISVRIVVIFLNLIFILIYKFELHFELNYRFNIKIDF